MPPASKFSRLPREVREEFDRLRTEQGYTHPELLAYLKSRGVNHISLRNVDYYTMNLDRRMKRYRETQEVVRAWVSQMGGKEPEGEVGRLLIAMLRIVAFRHLADLGGAENGEAAKPAEIAVIARAIREMEAASSTIADRESKLREELRGELDRKVGSITPDPADPSRDIATLNKAKELVRGLL
jgi:uncharacterized protein DUF3486